jgi:ABC-type branched-subunit amino acid transport system ATPase component
VLLREAIDGFRASGAAVLLVEHNVEFVLGLCEHVVVLNFGQKIADGSSQEIRQSPVVIEAYLGAP